MDIRTIGLMGPIETASFKDILPPPGDQAYPKGLGGSPVNLLALELHQRGYNLILYSIDQNIDTEITFKGERLTIHYGPISTKPARHFFSQEIKWLTQAVLKNPPDFLHAHWTYEFALAAQATGLPYLITAHDATLNVLKHNFIPYRIVRTLMACKAIWKTRHLSVVSPYVAEHLKRYFFYRRPIRVITNGMPDNQFHRTKPIKSVDAPITFATILSGWSGLKNSELAIQAFALLRKNQPHSRLIMFGAGHGVNETGGQWTKAQGLNKGIEFAGFLPYPQLIERLCNEVDILVHPSLEESQGMTLIEAMAAGIPVIGGQNSGAVPWTLANGKAGVLVDITQPEQLAKAMLQLANDRDERQRLGQAGMAHAKEHFHISMITDAYLQAYQDILTENWT